MDSAKPLNSEGLNVYLCEVLLRFAQTEERSPVVERLERLLSSPDRSWTKKWLRDEPWVSHLFFYALVAGENALAAAKRHLLNRVLGEVRTWEGELRAAIRECAGLLQGDAAGERVDRAIGELIDYYGRMANGEVGADASPDFLQKIKLARTALSYLDAFGTAPEADQLLQELRQIRTVLGNGDAEGEEVKDAAALIDWMLTIRETLPGASHGAMVYPELRTLPGNYSRVADRKRKDAIPDGFERNLLAAGCAAACARSCADNDLDATLNEKADTMRDVATAAGALREHDNIQRLVKTFKDGRWLPPGLTDRIVCERKLNEVLFGMLYGCCATVNNGNGKNVPGIHLSSRTLKDGSAISPERERELMDETVGDVYCFLHGWDSRADEASDGLLLEWLTDRAGVDARLKVNLPILRYLEGGLTVRHIQSFLCDLVSQHMSGKLYHGESPRAKVSLDEPVKKKNDEGEGAPMVDSLPDETARFAPENAEDDDFKERLPLYRAMLAKALQALREFDPRCADYVYLTKIGTTGFAASFSRDPEAMALWDKWQAAGTPMPARDARVLSGIGRNNTNAFDNRMRKFLSEIKAGRIKLGLPEDASVKLIDFFSSLITKKA